MPLSLVWCDDGSVALLICRNCGREFKGKPTHGQSLPFCVEACKIAFADREVKRLRAEGKPLIEIGEDFVACLVCGKQMKVLGSHLAMVHNVETRGLGHLERNQILGLHKGARAMPAHSRKKCTGNPNIATYADEAAAARKLVNWGEVADLARSVPFPDHVNAKINGALVKNAHRMHEDACVTVSCKKCGRPFQKPKSKWMKFCSRECQAAGSMELQKKRQSARSLHSNGVSPELIATRLGLSIRQVRRALYSQPK